MSELEIVNTVLVCLLLFACFMLGLAFRVNAIMRERLRKLEELLIYKLKADNDLHEVLTKYFTAIQEHQEQSSKKEVDPVEAAAIRTMWDKPNA